MNVLVKEINDIIIKNNNVINENIIGINYLEKLKYLVINNLKASQDKLAIANLAIDLKKNNNQSAKFEFKNLSLILSINLYKDSLSKIKLCHNNDILSVVLDGIKTISLFDLHNKNKKTSLSISQNMGLVLSENTITSENIAAGSIIMDIISEKRPLNVEN